MHELGLFVNLVIKMLVHYDLSKNYCSIVIIKNKKYTQYSVFAIFILDSAVCTGLQLIYPLRVSFTGIGVCIARGLGRVPVTNAFRGTYRCRLWHLLIANAQRPYLGHLLPS